jgi:endonuclease YncB( thermonuclease family)
MLSCSIDAYANATKFTPDSKPFNLDGFESVGLCTDVYDGDTCKVVFPNKDCVDACYKWTIRMMGYDAPEIRGPTKDLGVAARDLLRSKILGKCVYVKCLEMDKYGRVLAYIHEIDPVATNGLHKISDTTVNDYILNTAVGAYEYTGGTKMVL